MNRQTNKQINKTKVSSLTSHTLPHTGEMKHTPTSRGESPHPTVLKQPVSMLILKAARAKAKMQSMSNHSACINVLRTCSCLSSFEFFFCKAPLRFGSERPDQLIIVNNVLPRRTPEFVERERWLTFLIENVMRVQNWCRRFLYQTHLWLTKNRKVKWNTCCSSDR